MDTTESTDESNFSAEFSIWIQEVKSELKHIADEVAAENTIPSLQDLCLRQLAACRIHRDSLMSFYSQVKTLVTWSIGEGGVMLKLDELKRRLEVEIMDFYQYFKDRNSVECIKANIGCELYEMCEDALVERQRVKKTLVESTTSGHVIERRLYRQTSDEERTTKQQGVYPYKALKEGMLWPNDVDPTRREQYLSDIEFENVFNMTKTEFEGLNRYKRRQLKQSVKLF